VVNIGRTTPTPILELAELVQCMLGIPQPLRARFVPYESFGGQYQDVRIRIPDTTKARKLLGYNPRVNVDEGLDHFVNWMRAAKHI